MMIRRSSLTLFALSVFATGASAQSTISPGEILESLAGSGEAAAAVSIDVAAIRAAPPPALQALATLPNISLVIEFDLNSDRIRPESYAAVGYIADALHHPVLLDYKFIVAGHADATGARQYNLELSQQRAEAVTEALTTTFRVEPDRLIAIGLGEEQPRDPANPEAASNRRVQLLNIGPR
jgi:outer membrane protein OmpA-like peptidoglycan-associated protein